MQLSVERSYGWTFLEFLWHILNYIKECCLTFPSVPRLYETGQKDWFQAEIKGVYKKRLNGIQNKTKRKQGLLVPWTFRDWTFRHWRLFWLPYRLHAPFLRCAIRHVHGGQRQSCEPWSSEQPAQLQSQESAYRRSRFGLEHPCQGLSFTFPEKLSLSF